MSAKQNQFILTLLILDSEAWTNLFHHAQFFGRAILLVRLIGHAKTHANTHQTMLRVRNWKH